MSLLARLLLLLLLPLLLPLEAAPEASGSSASEAEAGEAAADERRLAGSSEAPLWFESAGEADRERLDEEAAAEAATVL